jgi:hypothetical protein
MSLRRYLTSLAIFAFAMAAMFAAVQPSFAEDDDDNEPNFMSKLLGSVGLLQLPGPHIDYQERPPLVVPPISPYVQPVAPSPQPNANSTQQNPWDFNAPPAQNITAAPDNQRPPQTALTLPQPVEPYTARQRNPDFPLDPEVKAAQKRKKTKRMFSRAEDDPSYSGRTLTPAELAAVKGRDKQGSGTDATTNEAQSTIQQLGVPTLTKMLPMIGREKEKPVEFTGEPERQTLTQPPTGYLTPSKNAPYGTVAKDKNGRDDSRIVHPNMPDYSGPRM